MTCSASQSSSVAKLGLKPRYLWPEACAFSAVQLGGGEKGAYREERAQGAFAVVVLVTLTLASPGMGPSSGLPQPPLDLSPRTAVVASHAEEVVTVTGRAGRGSGRGRGWRPGEAGCPWGPGGGGLLVPQDPRALSTPVGRREGRVSAAPSHPSSRPPRMHSSSSSPFFLLSPLLHFFPSFSYSFFFLFNNRLYQNQNSGPKGGGRGVAEGLALANLPSKGRWGG